MRVMQNERDDCIRWKRYYEESTASSSMGREAEASNDQAEGDKR